MEPRRPRTAEREQPARQTSCSLGRAVSGAVGQKIQQAQNKTQANLWECGRRGGGSGPHRAARWRRFPDLQVCLSAEPHVRLRQFDSSEKAQMVSYSPPSVENWITSAAATCTRVAVAPPPPALMQEPHSGEFLEAPTTLRAN